MRRTAQTHQYTVVSNNSGIRWGQAPSCAFSGRSPDPATMSCAIVDTCKAQSDDRLVWFTHLGPWKQSGATDMDGRRSDNVSRTDFQTSRFEGNYGSFTYCPTI
jgi:hypothetical protein